MLVPFSAIETGFYSGTSQKKQITFPDIREIARKKLGSHS
jgi:hypothetical protein